ncbi:MAG: bifunctional aspartate kinase/diaminopimelate decarboxylase, partial [Rhodothermales bacterium]|nr:bifunctional aspartate kinase/diaminopimelate decarboxylase [Rhodothermales bacterium]
MSTSPWIVMKFGGTSVSTAERWATIRDVVQQRIDEGVRPFVVCSAVSKISRALNALLDEALHGQSEPLVEQIQARHRALADDLGLDADAVLGDYFTELERLALGATLTRDVSPPLRARVLAMGELMSTTLGAAFLRREGLAAEWLDARDHLVARDDPRLMPHRRYLSATCHHDPDPALQETLGARGAAAFLTQGFIASTRGGETVLVGWGGSDTSAAYFASKLEAGRLEIWTDVPGMFTANPHRIPSARLLRQLDYDEAQELASTGAEVLHPRSIDPTRRRGIPLHIRCTQAPQMEHTVVSHDVPDTAPQVKAISARKGITLIAIESPEMWHAVGFLARVFTEFERHDLSVDLIATSETNVTVSLDPMETDLDPAVVQSLLSSLGAFCTARQIGPCAAVSLVGRNMRSILHEMGPALDALEEQTIHLVTQSASDLNLTFVVDEQHADRLVRALHAEFFDHSGADALFGPSWRELFDAQPAGPVAATPWWHARRDDLLALAEDRAPVYVYDEATLRAAAERLRRLRAVDRFFYAMKANPHADVLRLFERLGLGFECVSPGEVAHIRALFPDLDPARMLFTPNFAPRDEYAAVLGTGSFVTLDNLHPLEAWP